MYEIRRTAQVRRFQKKIKDTRLKSAFIQTCETLADTPLIGTPKKGDLTGIRTCSIILDSVQYRIAYMILDDDKIVILVFAGTREDFYQELKRYMKTVDPSAFRKNDR